MNEDNQDPLSRQSFYISVFLLFQGCYEKTLDLLRDNLMIIGAIGIAVAVIQVCQGLYGSIMENLESDGIILFTGLERHEYFVVGHGK